jgi:CheY-like chemotaxis protein
VITLPTKHRVLIVDDEPDIHSITTLSLRGIAYAGHPVEFYSARSGREAIQAMREHPDTSVILLDVVMETPSAGLDACRAIREELGNRFVRILLRTGQPGAAPERKAIDELDIDGYLPKAELTTNRLYAAVRTALKAYEELISLERHRQISAFLHDSVVQLRAFGPLETTLQRILETAVAIVPSSLAVLDLHTIEEDGQQRRTFLHIATDADPIRAQQAAEAVAARVATDASTGGPREAGSFDDSLLVPLVLHRDLGFGWIYLQGATTDQPQTDALCLLAEHAANALYASVASSLLAAREAPFYATVTV